MRFQVFQRLSVVLVLSLFLSLSVLASEGVPDSFVSDLNTHLKSHEEPLDLSSYKVKEIDEKVSGGFSGIGVLFLMNEIVDNLVKKQSLAVPSYYSSLTEGQKGLVLEMHALSLRFYLKTNEDDRKILSRYSMIDLLLGQIEVSATDKSRTKLLIQKAEASTYKSIPVIVHFLSQAGVAESVGLRKLADQTEAQMAASNAVVKVGSFFSRVLEGYK